MSPGITFPLALALATILGARQIPEPVWVFLLGLQPPHFLEPLAGMPLLETTWASSAAGIPETLNSNIRAGLQLARPCLAIQTGVPVCADRDVSPGDKS